MKLLSHVLIVLFSSLASANVSTLATMSGFTEIAGTTTDYKIKEKDGFVDFSLVIPAMTIDELMNFDLGRIISPENDTLNILSKSFEVPSNLSLPKQTESYFLSFTLDKPDFRAYVKDMGHYNLYAVHGTFPIKKVVDGAQGGMSIFEMVNLFTFQGGGSELIEVKGPTKDVKIGIKEWSFTTSTTVTAPSVASGKEVLAFSLFKDADEFYPTDIKRVLSGKTEKLTTRSGVDSYVLSVLLNNTQSILIDNLTANGGNIFGAIFGTEANRATFDLGQISYSIQKVGATPMTATFLPQVPAPKFANDTLTAVPPQTIAGVSPYATLVVLSEVTTAGSASLPLDFKNVLWSAPLANWQASAAVPTSATALMQKGKKYSMEVIYLGTAAPASDATIDWTKVTHVTRSTLTLNP